MGFAFPVVFGDWARVSNREGFHIAAVDPAYDIGAGISDLEPATHTGTYHLYLIIKSQGSENAVAGAGARAQGQTIYVHIIVSRPRPDG